MKKFILIFAGLFLSFFVNAQSNKEEVEIMQAAFGMDKRAAIAEFVKPSETQKVAFWAMYDEYETKRKELGKERIELLKEYANQYQKMNGEQSDIWTKKVIALQKKTDLLLETYYHKVKKISDGKVATQFYQIEMYILTAIRMQILKEVPFIEK
jgi:hypothetical protein